MMNIKPIIEQYGLTGELSRPQLIGLLAVSQEEEFNLLRQTADQVRQQTMGTEVHVRGIIEFSNHCIRSCTYCGINHHNQQVIRYRMSPDEIVSTAIDAVNMGFKTIVLQSGDDFYYTTDMVADMVRAIKQTGAAVTLAAGERPEKDYYTWREAGADRYLLKFETSNPELYGRLHPGTSLDKRLDCLMAIRRSGYQVGSGFMVGLPGQSLKDLADDLLMLKNLQVEMAGMGPFIPHPMTPLGTEQSGSVFMSLKVLATARLLMPWAHLPATTALSSLDKDGRKLGLTGGANILMPNLTPVKYRTFYEIYPHKAEVIDEPEKLYLDTLELIKELGREAGKDVGHGRRAGAVNREDVIIND